MADTTTHVEAKLPGWFSSTCDRLWKAQRAFWILFGLGVLAGIPNVFLTLQWPFAANKSLDRTFLGWCFHNSLVLLLICLLYLACFGIVYIGHQFYLLKQSFPPPSLTPEQLHEQQLREEQLHKQKQEEERKQIEQQQAAERQRHYLNRMIRDTRNLIPKGVPDFASSVPLDEVFIPLQFKPGRPPSDKPIPEQELRRNQDFLQRSGHQFAQGATEELERVRFASELRYERSFKELDRVNFAYLWKNCTPENPVAVIQGYPGMGKSTLTQRLTLYMARHGLNLSDPGIEEVNDTQPILIPILIPLKEYADAYELDTSQTLKKFLTGFLQKLDIPGVDEYVLAALQSGRCLVMLDGLDEVSKLDIREVVQEKIREFVAANADADADIPSSSFNRFLITSRVAGYDPTAFPEYLPYVIAELSPEQINNFLPRWCCAIVRNVRAPGVNAGTLPEQDAAIVAEANQLAGILRDAIDRNQGIHDMAENPLLLTLLAVMQQVRGGLPNRRVELYKEVTKMLLEGRNKAGKLEPIPEKQAIAYLGPLAFHMQHKGNRFARKHDVLISLQSAIKKGDTSLTDTDAMDKAEKFLLRVGERSGLFVQRTGDYYGFIHRTFQEYFAAHYLLNAIQEDQQGGITKLVGYARQPGDIWREPFLFAVAYQSDNDGKIADMILRSLLQTQQNASKDQIHYLWPGTARSAAHFAENASKDQQIHDLLLAAACIIEAKPLSIDTALEREIASCLLQTYEQGQREPHFDVRQQIEEMIRRWLLSLPNGDYRLSLPVVMRDGITDTRHVPLQRAVLTVLAMIAPQLADCLPNIFATLIPSLLALTGLPAVGNYKPAAGAASASLDVVDLALIVLSFLGKPGPSGIMLKIVRDHFAAYPEHLRLLARYSLENGTLITPTVVPLSNDNYQHYEQAIKQWIALRESQKTPSYSEDDVATCLNIHQALLDAAEEVMYPTAMLLLALVQESAAHPEQRWQKVWQGKLELELNRQSYIDYQQACLLWTTLFIDRKDQERLAHLLLDHYNNPQVPRYHYTLRFFTNNTENLRGFRDIRDIKEFRDIRDIRYLRYIRNFRDIIYITEFRIFMNTMYFIYSRSFREVKFLLYFKEPKFLEYIISIRYIRSLIFTQEVTGKAMKRLATIVEQSEQTDLLSLLLGRVLHIIEEKQRGESVEYEIQQIVRCVYPAFTSASNYLIRDAALDILSYLPARSVAEITDVLKLAEEAEDEQVQQKCAMALQYADPETEEAWRTLESGRQSRIMEVRKAVEERINRRR